LGTRTPFGGISLITVGDLFQLKPVFDKWIFENSQSGYNEFPTELTQIMRRKDAKELAELPNCLREGNHSEHDSDFETTASECKA